MIASGVSEAISACMSAAFSDKGQRADMPNSVAASATAVRRSAIPLPDARGGWLYTELISCIEASFLRLGTANSGLPINISRIDICPFFIPQKCHVFDDG